ncbi:Panacea domain-containing protein [Rothia terrae]|uniref:DUF4065 domain-containing protein n=1 Tax=Rothia terrae TaxID=396015 RepID=A0A7H2BAV9_9MICC|nr:type II toxin-antitoxin system antitoxin SocA domain-containing protein [Rothia terrae]QNV36805.1 DUF4065 domain-containing protein [Rothia terrae]
MYTAIQLNSYLKTKVGAHDTKMKRMKLLYYAQAWHLAWYGRPLFDDEIQAWDMGPVPASVYYHEKSPVTSGSAIALEPAVEHHIKSIIAFYGNKTGTQLSSMTHEEDPWKEAYSSGKNQVISKDAMFRYFSQVSDRPLKPPASAKPVSNDKLQLALAKTNEKFRGVDKILADR